MKNLYCLLFVVCLVTSCSQEKTSPLSDFNFPLNKRITIPVNGDIHEIAVANTWIAVNLRDEIVAIDLETHKTMWSIKFSAITYAKGLLTIDDTLIAASPTQIISVNRDGQVKNFTLDPDLNDIISLVSANSDYLYFVDGSWIFGAYDISNGGLMWKTSVGRGGGDEAYYDSLDNLVYVSGGSVRVINNATGKIEWERNRNVLCSVFESGVLYEYEKADQNNHYRINAVNIKSQKNIWSKDFTFPPSGGVNKLTVIDDILFLSGSDVIALDKSNGDQIWETSTGETFYTSPVRLDSYLYIKSGAHTVHAISPIDGSLIGTITLKDYSILSGADGVGSIYRIEDSIVFNTENLIVIYNK